MGRQEGRWLFEAKLVIDHPIASVLADRRWGEVFFKVMCGGGGGGWVSCAQTDQ